MLSDATIRAVLQQDLSAWDPTWGEQAAWTKEIAWSLTAAIDLMTASPDFRARYSATRGHPAMDPRPKCCVPWR